MGRAFPAAKRRAEDLFVDVSRNRSWLMDTYGCPTSFGGPLFFSHYSFLGLDPRRLRDRYADYWWQNRAHTLINRAHCIANPRGHAG